MRSIALALALAVGLLGHTTAAAGEAYKRAPSVMGQILDAPSLPMANPSPTGSHVLQLRMLRYPPIARLAEPMLRLAGVRFDPRNRARAGSLDVVELTIRSVIDGGERKVALPSGSRVTQARWNAAGTKIAFSNATADTLELWVVDAASGKAKRIPGVQLNGTLDDDIQWLPDGERVVVRLVPRRLGAVPGPPAAPAGPRIEDSAKVDAASSTYEARDLLRTPHDADVFEHYAQSQLAIVDLRRGGVRRIGPVAAITDVSPSPDGRFLLVEHIERPYSFERPYQRFPTKVELWDQRGARVQTVAQRPLADRVPIGGVPTGPRDHEWLPNEPATLVWVEALDGGDSFKKVDAHDRVMIAKVGEKPIPAWTAKQRLGGIRWLEGGRTALISEVDQDRHRVVTKIVDFAPAAPVGRVLWDRSQDDSYGDPGQPVSRLLPNGHRVVRVHEGAIFLQGRGATQTGDRPFLDRLDLASKKTERLFRSDVDALEPFVAWVDPVAGTFLTQHESPNSPPNLVLRTLGQEIAAPAVGEASRASSSRRLTDVKDPVPGLRKISKQLVKYRRADGVELSFTLYLPPDHRPGTRLPTVLWAYPLDYTDRGAAGQVRGFSQEFTWLRGPSPVFLALAGYAVLDDVAMPVVGPTPGAYDTFVEQVVANAEAAIDKAVELGVADRDRVGVMGHSHGALMTANLLIYSDLFRAGVARSGAYNHTLRPFGFQNERRTLYQARKTYERLSPTLHADAIDEPLLVIHGALDVNPGTTPQQSEKLYEAIRGVGGTSRLVMLPFESHGYLARESTEHVIAETLEWFDRHVKNAGPRAKKSVKSQARASGTSPKAAGQRGEIRGPQSVTFDRAPQGRRAHPRRRGTSVRKPR